MSIEKLVSDNKQLKVPMSIKKLDTDSVTIRIDAVFNKD